MTTEIQDLTWACLPKEARDNIKSDYNTVLHNPRLDKYDSVFLTAFENLFGHNLTSDTEPEEMLMVSRSMIQNKYAYNESILKFDPTHQGAILLKKNFDFLFGDKCLPDKEAEQPEPKKFFESDYSIGDKVIVCISSIGEPRKEVATLIRHYQPQCEYNDYAKTWVIQTQDGQTFQSNEEHFEPYTEENKETMEEKELNLCELLKGCEGEEFYSPISNEPLTLKSVFGCSLTFLIDNEDELTVDFDKQGHITICSLDETSQLKCITDPNSLCLVYPSRTLYEKYPLDAYSAWMEWKEARKPKRWRAKSSAGVAVSECKGHWEDYSYWYVTSDGVIAQDEETNCKTDNLRYNIGNYFRTEEEAKQAAEAVRKTLEEFHSNHTEQ